MAYTLQNSINFALPFIQYSPLTAGLGQEPAASIGTLIRNSFLGAPQTWYFNRNEITFSTVVGQQDYSQSFAANGNDFGYIEKLSLTDDQGNIHEIKDVYNTLALAVSAFQQRPNAVSVKSVTYSGATQSVGLRFLGVPDQIYTATVTYQKKAPLFGPFFISSCGNAAGGNTTYTGVFDAYSLPANASVNITGFVTNAVNNGTFTVVSCTSTSLVVANASGVAETHSAFVTNFDWSPIPDQFSDVYNNLFLSEALSMADDARSQIYRQRGIAAFLSRASGLSEMQRDAFTEQWSSRDVERAQAMAKGQLVNNSRGV